MGSADVIPGISGGTIAFIMGFYENLIGSIRSLDKTAVKLLLTGKWAAFFSHIHGSFFIPLLLGIATSFIFFAQLVETILSDPEKRVLLYSLFLGLILASTILCFKRVRHWTITGMSACLLAAIVANVLTDPDLLTRWKPDTYVVKPNDHFLKKMPQVNDDLQNFKNYTLYGVTQAQIEGMVSKNFLKTNDIVIAENNQAEVSVQTLELPANTYVEPWLVLSGMMAVSAMLLPGISGSYLLNVFGVYPIAIGAVVDFTSGLARLAFDYDASIILGNILLGIVIGAVIFSHVVNYLLQHYHSVTLSALVGFMVGSLRAVWPFWTMYFYIDPLKPEKGAKLSVIEPYLPSMDNPLLLESGAFLLLGIGIVLGLHKLASVKQS